MADRRQKLTAQEETTPSGRKYKVRRAAKSSGAKKDEPPKTKARAPVKTSSGDVPTK